MLVTAFIRNPSVLEPQFGRTLHLPPNRTHRRIVVSFLGPIFMESLASGRTTHIASGFQADTLWQWNIEIPKLAVG
jgi:hypothetical protein